METLIELKEYIFSLEKHILKLEKRLDVLEKKPTRVKKEPTNKLQPQEHPKYEKLATKIMLLIKKNFPGTVPKHTFEHQVSVGSSCIRKLHKNYDYSLKVIERVLIWCTENSFWKGGFSSISTLCNKTKNDIMKFQHMLNNWELHSGLDGILYSAENHLIELNYDEDDVVRLLNDIEWFYLELKDVLESLPFKNKSALKSVFNKKTIEWFIDVDYDIVKNDIVVTGKDLMGHYLDYIEDLLDNNKINGIYASVFSNDRVFYRFIDHFNKKNNILVFGG